MEYIRLCRQPGAGISVHQGAHQTRDNGFLGYDVWYTWNSLVVDNIFSVTVAGTRVEGPP